MVLIYLIQWISAPGEIMKYQMIIAKVHKSKSKAKYYIKIKDKSLNVDLKLNGKILSQFTDTMLDK